MRTLSDINGFSSSVGGGFLLWYVVCVTTVYVANSDLIGLAIDASDVIATRLRTTPLFVLNNVA